MERVTLFYEILGISSSIYGEIVALFPSNGPLIDIELVTFLLSTIYLGRHFSADLWLEFFYSLTVNILFMGQWTPEKTVATVLKLTQAEHDKLLKSLKVFAGIPPRGKGYQAQIVHQYNAFQNCLNNIAFLAQILDLADGTEVLDSL